MKVKFVKSLTVSFYYCCWQFSKCQTLTLSHIGGMHVRGVPGWGLAGRAARHGTGRSADLTWPVPLHPDWLPKIGAR